MWCSLRPERVVVDVLFDRAGALALEHHTPHRVSRLASIEVSEDRAAPSLEERFGALRTHRDMVFERERIAPYLEAEPDKTLSLLAEMDMGAPEGGAVAYACPMHPDVVSDEPGHCPKCGLKLLAVEAPATSYACPMHPRSSARSPGTVRSAG